MSDYFDTQLREGTARVAASFTTHTAADVREHAKRRTRRIALGAGAAATCAVIVIAGTAFGLAHQGGGTTGGVSGSHSGSASPSASPTPSGGGASAAAPNARQFVSGAWLGESDLPYAGSIAWQVDSQSLGTKLHGPVELILPNAYTDNLVAGFGTYCSIPALAVRAVANQEESFYGPITGSRLPSTPGIPARATQSIVFYRGQSDAATAWDAIGPGFALCAKFETGHVSAESATYPSIGTARRIVNEPTAQCWTSLAAVTEAAPKVTDLLDEVCLVRRGTLISSFDLGFEGPSTLSGLDFNAVDAALVTKLEHALTSYDGS